MTEVMVVEVGKDAIFTLLLVVGPLLLIAMVIGLLISLFQTLTQIQEMTLVFESKFLVSNEQPVDGEDQCLFNDCESDD